MKNPPTSVAEHNAVGWQFDNSYSRLPEMLFVPTRPSPVSPRQFSRSVARATGEDVATIERMGFQPLRRRAFEADPEAFAVDWDEAQAERNVTLCPPRRRSHAAA